jgi:hypothetical protein
MPATTWPRPAQVSSQRRTRASRRSGHAWLLPLVVATDHEDRNRPGVLVNAFEEPDRIATRQGVVRHDDVRARYERQGLGGR